MPTAITSGSSQVTLSTSGFFFMGEDEVLVTTGNGIEIDASNVNLFVNGTIFSDTRAVFANSTGTNANQTIVVGADGTLVGQTIGVGTGADDTELTNYGSITSLTGIGVNLELGAASATFANFGAVNGATFGLEINGSTQFAVNHGSIIGETGVRFANDENTFVNHGTVTGVAPPTGDQSFGILVGFNDDSFIQNFGTISGGTASISTSFFVDGLVIENHGLLIGDVDLGNGADTYIAGTDGTVVGQILTDEGNDTVRGGDHADDIDGGDGNDQIFARGGEDTILGGSGDDRIGGGAGDDIIDGGTGEDTLYGGDGNDVIDGGTGEDTLNGGDGNDVIDGGDNRDFIRGGAGDDFLLGNSGWDTLYAWNGDDTLDGGSGHDVLSGGRGSDELDGGSGRDTLNGGFGDDTLTGGTGQDVFVFRGNGGRDTITDFINGEDQIDLTNFGQFSFASLQSNFVVDLHGPNGSMIDFGNGDVLILENMTFGNLDESDFIFF